MKLINVVDMVVSRIKSIYRKYCYKILIDFGLMHEPRWVNLDIGLNHGRCTYLEDEHRNRDWFCRLVELLKKPSILEIGVGGMHELRMLKEKSILNKCSYHVIDISKQAVKEGKKLFPDVEFKDGRIDKIPYADGTFDIVYCRHVIEHLPGYEEAVKEMFRVSRGVVVINTFRWTVGATKISRVKKYSNSYNIYHLIEHCRSLSKSFDYFIILKDDVPGINKYEDNNIVRTRDHLIMILYKVQKFYNEIEVSKDNFRKFLIDRPYDSDQPKFQPSRKANG